MLTLGVVLYSLMVLLVVAPLFLHDWLLLVASLTTRKLVIIMTSMHLILHSIRIRASKRLIVLIKLTSTPHVMVALATLVLVIMMNMLTLIIVNASALIFAIRRVIVVTSIAIWMTSMLWVRLGTETAGRRIRLIKLMS